MLDQENLTETEVASRTYSLVVIGAGVAGLNALYAAVQYLPKGAPVLLLDQKDAAGGMWNTAYDYVHLHQPHPMFTVGDMKWNWQKPAEYLAARDEVQSHLASSLPKVRETADLETQFGTTVVSCEEITTPSGPKARVTFHPNGDPDDVTVVEADRAIFASGLNYRLASPLQLSSQAVVSIVPQDLKPTLSANPDAPVCVVGGGKTGMDTILAVLAENPGREVSLIKGRGTNFFNRTKFLPNGLKRWTSGRLVSRLFHDLAINFDGDNEDHTISYFRANYSTDPDTENGVFLYGLQSEDENRRVKDGLAYEYADYLEDVVDGPDGPQIVLRSGETQNLAAGTIVVNCTGSFFRGAFDAAHQCLSPGGAVLHINARDGFHFLTSVCGFFVTHLLYRDALRGKGFYTLDHEALFRQNRNAWIGASAAQAYLNQTIAVQNLPMMLLDKCGLDLDRWYPFPRRMAALIKMKSNAKADIAHCTKALDRVAERFDVGCGPIV